MKRIFKAAVAAVGFTALATSAMAEWTPPGPIKLMIAFAAGGGADTQARMIAEELETKLNEAIANEDYESASRIRDEIDRRKSN